MSRRALMAWARRFRTTPERRRPVYESVEEMSSPRAAYYAMVALSTIIATFGLLANSAPVVIGAMLVAPLMGPIFGVALGLTRGRTRLLGRAVEAEVLGVLLAVCLAAMIGLIPMHLGLGPEVMSTTQPTLYDLIVALASGLAGAYALVDPRLSPALPGVAVATALLPPLASRGLCLATGHWDWAGGQAACPTRAKATGGGRVVTDGGWWPGVCWY